MALALLIYVLVRVPYPNYDSFYALVWGREIAHLHLPDYDVFRTPTPHPLFNLYTAALSVFGRHAVRLMTLLSVAMYVTLLVGVYRMVRLKMSATVAVVSVIVLLTRTDLLAFALRSLVDIPFLNLLVWAAVLELLRPRRGVAPLTLLALAGLLRPEAWVLAGIYWLWLGLGAVRPDLHLPGEAPSRRQLMGYLGFVLAPPLIWVGLDWIITGHPLYSFQSTREVAGDLERQKSVVSAIGLIPRYVGASEPLVNTTGGVIGVAVAIYALRSRMVMLGALAATGVLTYLLIAIGGLSVIQRYLLLPSLVACIGVAFALSGWTQLRGRARRFGVAAAVVTFALVGVRAPAYAHEFAALNTATRQSSSRFGGITQVLDTNAVAAVANTCRPILSPTHEAVPVIRYNFGLAKGDVVATTQLHRAPTHGVQMVQSGYLDPIGLTNLSHTLRKPWTNFPLPGFALKAETNSWLVYVKC